MGVFVMYEVFVKVVCARIVCPDRSVQCMHACVYTCACFRMHVCAYVCCSVSCQVESNTTYWCIKDNKCAHKRKQYDRLQYYG